MKSRMSDNKNNLTIEKVYFLPGSLDDVWDCLADEDISSVWQSQNCVIGEKVGGKLELFGGWVIGEILIRTPKSEISYTWRVSDWKPDIEPSKVSYELEKIDKKTTKVILMHWDLPNIKERNSHDIGWDEQFFDIMIKFLKLNSD